MPLQPDNFNHSTGDKDANVQSVVAGRIYPVIKMDGDAHMQYVITRAPQGKHHRRRPAVCLSVKL